MGQFRISTVSKFIALALSIVLVVMFSASLVSASAQTVYVYDYADLLSDGEEQELATYAKNQSEQYSISITILTYDDAGGKSTMTYTDDFYDENIAAQNGFLLAIDMDNREVYLNTVGTCIENISDYEVDEILDNTYMYASDAEYADFFSEAMVLTLEAYSGSLSTVGGSSEPSYSNPWIPTAGSLIATVVVMILVAVILLAIHNKNNKAPSAETYMGSSFEVNNTNTMFMGVRHEVLHNYYADNDSGGSSHMSGGGVSHGGGGRGF